MARMTLEIVARGWRPCISGSAPREKMALPFQIALILDSPDGLERHIESRIARPFIGHSWVNAQMVE